MVSKLAAQFFDNDPKRVALVVAFEVLNVFQKEGFRLFLFENLDDVEEKCSLGGVVEAVCSPEAILLADPGKAERLTGKATNKNIMFWNILWIYLGDVTGNFVIIGVVGTVGLAGKFVPFRSEHTPTSCCLEAESSSSDSGEEIDETEGWQVSGSVWSYLLCDLEPRTQEFT